MTPAQGATVQRGSEPQALPRSSSSLPGCTFPHGCSTGTLCFTWDSSSPRETCQNSAKFSLEGEKLFLKKNKKLFKAKHSKGLRISRLLKTENGKEVRLFLNREICQFCPDDKNLPPTPNSVYCCFLQDNSLYDINHNNEIQMKAGVCWF